MVFAFLHNGILWPYLEDARVVEAAFLTSPL
jgi:hypothetical protein